MCMRGTTSGRPQTARAPARRAGEGTRLGVGGRTYNLTMPRVPPTRENRCAMAAHLRRDLVEAGGHRPIPGVEITRRYADDTSLLVGANDPENRLALGSIRVSRQSAGSLRVVARPIGLQLDPRVFRMLTPMDTVENLANPEFKLVIAHPSKVSDRRLARKGRAGQSQRRRGVTSRGPRTRSNAWAAWGASRSSRPARCEYRRWPSPCSP